jgi:hypothetical protein
MIAACAVAVAPLVVARIATAEPAERRAVRDRFLLAGVVALLAALPFLARLDFTLSPGERAWLADHLRTHYARDWQQRYARLYPLAVLRFVVGALNDAFLACSLLGLWLARGKAHARGLAALGLTAGLLVALAGTARWGGLGPLVVFPERPLAVLAVVLCAGLAFVMKELMRSPRLLQGAALLILAGTAAERAHRYYWSGARNVMVGPDDFEAMGWIAAHTRPLDLVCNDYGSAGLWVPAIAGRAISAPHLPPFYFEEFREGSKGRRCALTYLSSRPFFVAPAPRDESAGHRAFRNATVTLLEGGAITSFDITGMNSDPRAP